MRYTQKASDGKRGAEFSERSVPCPKAYDRKAMLAYGAKACPGDIVSWVDSAERRHMGRVLGRVDAYRINDDIPEVKGHLVVIRFDDTLAHAYEVWVDPADVTTVDHPSPKLMAFLLGPLPALPDVLKLSSDGALCERYIEKYTK